jgi:hypothetical protein
VLQAVAKRVGFRSVELVTKGDPLDYGLPAPNPTRSCTRSSASVANIFH